LQRHRDTINTLTDELAGGNLPAARGSPGDLERTPPARP
jgi:hypothetical protein